MVVGDSLGQNLGRALERRAKRTGEAVVWDLSLPGCPVTRGGVRRVEGGTEWPVAEACGWWSTSEARRRLDSFRPDVVFMHTGHNELYDRRGVAPWGDEWHGPGEGVFDEWQRAEWRGAASAFAATGATVVWAVPPCVDASRSPGLVSDSEGNRRLGHLRAAVPAMAATGAVVSADLHGTICPGGRFSNTVMGVEDARPDGFHIADAAADVLVERWLAPLLLDHAR